MVAAPPLIEKLKGSPTSWVLFAAACLQTFNCALGVWLTKVTTVSVPPAGARKTAVPVLVSIDTFLPVGERVIDYRHYIPELAKKPQALRQVASELIAETVQTRGWLIFYSHDVAEQPSRFGISPHLLELAACTARRAGCLLTNIADGVNLIGGTASEERLDAVSS